MPRRFIRIVLIALVCFAGASAATRPATARQEANIVADSGFSPAENGFGFQNYGNEGQPVNLTTVEMRRLFGDEVCAGTPDAAGACDLTPPAAEWMEKINQNMGGGHCDGMATLASVLYYKLGNEAPDQFGKPAAVQIDFDSNAKLQREIAYWFSTQATQPANTQDIKAPPAQIVEALIASIKGKTETYTVGIYQPDMSGGHSITPYAVQDMGAGKMWIMVYDNNFPKEARHIEVDMTANTWTYFTASNPNEAGAGYTGNADTLTLTLTPDSARLGKQTCPVCAATTAKINGLAQAAKQYNEVWLVGDNQPGSALDLLITDDAGHRLGQVGGKLINEIPGASFAAVRSGPKTLEDEQEPVYYIPVGVKISVTLDASKSKREETASLSLIGPGHEISIDNIQVQPGEVDKAVFAADGKSVTYTPSSSESPDISIGTATAGADYGFDLYGFDLDKGASVNVRLDETLQKLIVSTVGNTNPSIYALSLEKLDKQVNQQYYNEGIELAPGAAVYIDYGTWDGKGELTLEIDKDNNGTPDSTMTEPNSPKPPQK